MKPNATSPSAAGFHLLPFLALAVSAGCHASAPAPAAGTAPSDLNERLSALLETSRANLVFVEGGSFLMGDFGPVHSPERLPYSGERNDDVLRDVTLDSFSIAAYMVTYADFDVFTDHVGRPRVAMDPVDLEYRDLPGTPAGVNWYDAQAYCQWLGEQLDLKMDLPTEAQWEYAARSRGQMVIYPTDDGTIDEGRNVASFEQFQELRRKHGESFERGWASFRMPIGEYPPNPLGLHDMIDKGFEWVGDWYSPAYDPNDVDNPLGPDVGTEKVVRGHNDTSGGQLQFTSMTFTRNSRLPDPPPLFFPGEDEPLTRNQNSSYGFRCAASSPD